MVAREEVAARLDELDRKVAGHDEAIRSAGGRASVPIPWSMPARLFSEIFDR